MRRGGFDEKRVVDLIVQLVTERVEEIVLRALHERFGSAAGHEPAQKQTETG